MPERVPTDLTYASTIGSRLLRKLLNNEIKTRSRRNVVKARLFSEMLAEAVRKYQNRAIQAAQVIEELIGLAKQVREDSARGEQLGLSEDEVAFYDALEVNDSAVKVLGDATLKALFVGSLRGSAGTCDVSLHETRRNAVSDLTRSKATLNFLPFEALRKSTHGARIASKRLE